jgi:hypothetical protein
MYDYDFCISYVPKANSSATYSLTGSFNVKPA